MGINNLANISFYTPLSRTAILDSVAHQIEARRAHGTEIINAAMIVGHAWLQSLLKTLYCSATYTYVRPASIWCATQSKMALLDKGVSFKFQN